MTTTTDLTSPEIPLEARNATLADLAGILQAQQAIKHDVVVPAAAIRSERGVLSIDGAGPDGPLSGRGLYVPTAICDEGIAEKLQIPTGYLRRMRAERIDLYDANVNGWLSGSIAPGFGDALRETDPDARRFLVRSFATGGNEPGIARAFLSDSYKRMDNLDALLATLEGARNANAEVEVRSAELSERRMTLRLWAPEVTVAAEEWLKLYRSPFGDGTANGRDYPLVAAGITVSNSETGGSSYEIAPQIVVLVCRNGQTRKQDALRKIHLGAKLSEGVVQWSDETQANNVALIRSMTTDAVASFLNVEYLRRVVEEVTEKAVTPLTEPAKAVEIVTAKLRYPADVAAGILDHFIRGGDTTAGGLMGAVTSFAQVVDSPDLAVQMEEDAFTALDLAVAAAR